MRAVTEHYWMMLVKLTEQSSDLRHEVPLMQLKIQFSFAHVTHHTISNKYTQV